MFFSSKEMLFLSHTTYVLTTHMTYILQSVRYCRLCNTSIIGKLFQVFKRDEKDGFHLHVEFGFDSAHKGTPYSSEIFSGDIKGPLLCHRHHSIFHKLAIHLYISPFLYSFLRSFNNPLEFMSVAHVA